MVRRLGMFLLMIGFFSFQMSNFIDAQGSPVKDNNDASPKKRSRSDRDFDMSPPTPDTTTKYLARLDHGKLMKSRKKNISPLQAFMSSIEKNLDYVDWYVGKFGSEIVHSIESDMYDRVVRPIDIAIVSYNHAALESILRHAIASNIMLATNKKFIRAQRNMDKEDGLYDISCSKKDRLTALLLLEYDRLQKKK